MNCTHCEHAETEVLDTRRMPGMFAVRRRRRCAGCGYVFPTYEIDGGIWGTVSKWAAGTRSAALSRQAALRRRNAEIVRRVKAGEKRYLLAEEYGLSTGMLSHICTQAGLPKKSRHAKEPCTS